MEVILLEKISKLGELGEIVRVKDGYARNYLLPRSKALFATKENRSRFETERLAFEQRQQEVKAAAEALAARINGVAIVLERPAGVMDKLFGSVTNNDIAQFLTRNGIDIPRGIIEPVRPIRTLGEHAVRIKLHPDVTMEVAVRVERGSK
ncbi:MAG: 50S ribosomal protein L9 [Magnetococcales bacterium]|nr:50S ribosomal protein L9 [Magnetococcales bacterium]